jgi:hypothetical protein
MVKKKKVKKKEKKVQEEQKPKKVKKEKKTESKPKTYIARDFGKTEIIEINRYVTSNVPFSVLERIFPLTENAHNKAQVFTIVYRIINSAMQYVGNEGTRKKLKSLLDECEQEYKDIYNALMRYESGGFGSYNNFKIITDILSDIDKNSKINKLIDIFLVFAEKQTFFDIEKVAGIESSKKEGSDIVDKIIGKTGEKT